LAHALRKECVQWKVETASDINTITYLHTHAVRGVILGKDLNGGCLELKLSSAKFQQLRSKCFYVGLSKKYWGASPLPCLQKARGHHPSYISTTITGVLCGGDMEGSCPPIFSRE